MSNIERNRAGTAYITRQDGILLYQCQYCDTWFEPTTRFKQKYCNESCRVMACRERQRGLAGTLLEKRDKTSNTDLLRQMKLLQVKNQEGIEQVLEKLLSRQHDNDLKLVKEIANLKGDLKAMNNKMDWVMILVAIAPVASPAIVNWFQELATGKKPPAEQIIEELKQVKDKLDESTRLQLKKLLEEQKLEEIINLMGL